MARTKKPSADDAGELMVSVESYTRTRDSPRLSVEHAVTSPTTRRDSPPIAPAIPPKNTAKTYSHQQVIVSLSNLQAGLAHVQSGLNELLRAYLEHTNSVIAGEDGVLDKLSLGKEIAATANTAIEAASSTANGIAQALTASEKADDAGKPVKATKRKREKKEKDPNAPKKPLTAAFLYAQTARPIVRGDLEAALGPDQKLEPNAVNLEVTKRWNEMPEEDKETWRQSYRDSMEQWKEEMAAYQASKGSAVVPIEDDDEASEAEVEIAAESDSSDEDEEPAPAKAPSPPVKTPRANKRQKLAQNPAVNGVAAPVIPAASPIPLPRSTASAAATPTAATAETPAKKERKKKEKADKPAPQAIAPAPAKEASPEEAAKKKTKSSRSTRNNEAEEKENVAQPEKEKKKRERKRKAEGAAA
ncbi:hypothetical protein E8E13_000318 [Curvularia kusanoi]|uniref:HMG box domain-containing protein n=1 Tax=Curvularia kusanoi TaxID=90978 RepID=A0A9P4WAM3_CURKU|nr:hypothetical protein E8E13_000318 [Curvularia kusanoi]